MSISVNLRTFSLLAWLVLALSVTGCYRMPTENDFSVVPTTNNRDVTRERYDASLPNVRY